MNTTPLVSVTQKASTFSNILTYRGKTKTTVSNVALIVNVCVQNELLPQTKIIHKIENKITSMIAQRLLLQARWKNCKEKWFVVALFLVYLVVLERTIFCWFENHPCMPVHGPTEGLPYWILARHCKHSRDPLVAGCLVCAYETNILIETSEFVDITRVIILSNYWTRNFPGKPFSKTST